MGTRLAELLTLDAISARLVATDARGVLTELSALLAPYSGLSAGELVTALEKREEISSTGIGGGVAIPHCRLPRLHRIHACLGVSAPGIPFRAADGQPVHVFFGLASPPEAVGEHLKVLSRIAGIFRHTNLARELLRNRDAASMQTVLREHEDAYLLERGRGS